MCVNEKYPSLRSLDVLRGIIRWIALFEGVVALMAVSVKLGLIAFEYETLSKNGTDQAAAREQTTQIVVLSVFVIQGLFAIVLNEGARKKILWMIKAWLAFSFLQLLIPMTMLFSNLFLLGNHKLPRTMIWTILFQIVLAIFHGIEATFVISFHKKATIERSDDFVSIEYHKDPDAITFRKSSDVSISVELEDE